MKSMSWNHSIQDFLEQTGSLQPTPGGGSVASLVTALGAAMTSMVGNFSQGESFEHAEEQMMAAVDQMKDLYQQCEELMQDDISSFGALVEAMKLPKETEKEQHSRRDAIHEAAVQAIEVPLRLMQACRDGSRCAYRIAKASNHNVASDLGIGAILFEAAAQAGLLTVQINLPSLHDSGMKDRYQTQASSLLLQVQENKEHILSVVHGSIN
ncbi:cyclodeaminase/cyclohydrolase family protein [Paenibacillus lemnae]|uniref:Cyclodeaminase/cyclohydrolase family protein n=1 Tax=Paenibacillus lemnae TaxID=1330551 RepID=A0A848M3H3_PAELE|nr:cyclodeaminase/cyclohydrolase family protein [Paenibacillus lemnae]NMO95136.1 cyclodeaminase/cyclohydrolase family protein [Paenibacillus lemnae]